MEDEEGYTVLNLRPKRTTSDRPCQPETQDGDEDGIQVCELIGRQSWTSKREASMFNLPPH
ncbi:hypothetical protein UY3_01466 [Chelonia mydas]|uniref:Uncharacterized protein n=1 Tax=Chelonia mydas TaxID=8469 RepID=M7BZK6_CHEMY|nr:hypothetical protein UY3_01466 [Chelonia mydas]